MPDPSLDRRRRVHSYSVPPRLVDPLVTVPASVNTVPGTGTRRGRKAGGGRQGVVGIPPCCRNYPVGHVRNRLRAKAKDKGSHQAVKGAGQRRITASLLLELSYPPRSLPRVDPSRPYPKHLNKTDACKPAHSSRSCDVRIRTTDSSHESGKAEV